MTPSASTMSCAPSSTMLGEHSAFDAAELEALFVATETALHNVVLRWCWNRDDAAEIVQEAFGRLWTMRARVDPARSRALVFRIALNLAASRRRWRRVRAFVGPSSERADERPLPEDDLIRAERRGAAGRAIEALPEPLRRALLLCELTDLSYAEIARILDTRPGTVGSRRHAALARVRRTLAEAEGAPHATS